MFKHKKYYSFFRYDREIVSIDIVIRAIDDIFRPVDYTSLQRKRINAELEDYIMKEVKSHSINKKLILVFHMPGNNDEKDISLIKDVVWNHFKMKTKERELLFKEQLTQWKINALIGILFLILCLILIEIFDAFSSIHILRIIKESLLIIGWVALSEPLALILFGRQNIKKDILYSKKLSNIPIIIERYPT